jgi:two-component system osmolarity sensor histidine kinase EnvZ
VKLLPGSLFGRAAVTTAVTLLVFLVFIATVTVYLVFMPLAQRSAEDLAAEIATGAETLPHLPADQRTRYVDQMLHDHEVIVVDATAAIGLEMSSSTYLDYFREALVKHGYTDFRITRSDDGSIVWVDRPGAVDGLRFGFPSDRLGLHPPLALTLFLVGGALLTIIVSILVVRRITQPLDRLTRATRQLGQGRLPAMLPVSGPREFAELAETFNQMSLNLKHLEDNRTVMVAGISHDLRTPLTRVSLAAEMLENNGNSELVGRIRRNVETINKLVGQFVEFSRGVETSMPVRLQLWDVVESLLLDLKPDGVDVRLNRCAAPCTYTADRNALERVLSNVLKNAVLYGNGKPIDINLACSEQGGRIEIMDRGPGIPPAQSQAVFEPFYRLESHGNSTIPGSGLGLAIARQLARKHGWNIELLPREGGGTVARIQLPPSQQSEPAARTAA